MDGLRRDSVPDRGATGVAVVIWCRCNAHLVESDDDQTPNETCCVCRGKILRAARWRWYAAGHINADKRAAQRVPAVAPLMSICHPTMPDAHRDVKHNTPPRAAGGSDGQR